MTHQETHGLSQEGGVELSRIVESGKVKGISKGLASSWPLNSFVFFISFLFVMS
jgi:hypothetical protein